LTSFAGLHFENEAGLTELDAAECRRITPLCVSKRRQWQKRYSHVIGQAKNSLAGCSNILPPPFLIITSLKPLFFQISNTKKEE